VETLRQITRQLDWWWTHAMWCVNSPVATPACKTFWTWMTIAAVVIGLWVLWKILAWLLRPVRAWLAEMRRQAQGRKIADAETMAQYKVDDSKLHATPAQENVEQKIRDALLEKKLTDQQQRHHQKTGNNKP
jgi:biopolymer transport protein ExbB/TolQ